MYQQLCLRIVVHKHKESKDYNTFLIDDTRLFDEVLLYLPTKSIKTLDGNDPSPPFPWIKYLDCSGSSTTNDKTSYTCTPKPMVLRWADFSLCHSIRRLHSSKLVASIILVGMFDIST